VRRANPEAPLTGVAWWCGHSTAAFRAIYDGFQHAGLQTRLDEHDQAVLYADVGRAGGQIIDVASGEEVGQFNRYIGEGNGALIVRHESINLTPRVRGRGFVRVLQAHAEWPDPLRSVRPSGASGFFSR
jgi:hypothetical protein